MITEFTAVFTQTEEGWSVFLQEMPEAYAKGMTMEEAKEKLLGNALKKMKHHETFRVFAAMGKDLLREKLNIVIH